MSKIHRRALACTFVLTLLAFAAPALAAPPTLVGSWEAVASIDGNPIEDFLLETYSLDRTFVASGPRADSTIAHGAWKRVGARTFETAFVILLYNPDSTLAARLRGSTEVEVSLDGETYDGVLTSVLTAADGTLIGSFTGTVEGTRISVD